MVVANTESLGLGICLTHQVVDLGVALKLLIESLRNSTCSPLELSQNQLAKPNPYSLLTIVIKIIPSATLTSNNLQKSGAIRLHVQ